MDFTRILDQINTTLRTTNHVKKILSQEFLERVQREGEDALLHWLIRFLYWGPANLDSLENGLARIESSKPEVMDQIKQRIENACAHKGKNFRIELDAALAEILALDYLLSLSSLDIKSVNFLELIAEPNSRTPDFELLLCNEEKTYVEVKHLRDEDDLEQQIINRIFRESILDPESFAFEFTVSPSVNQYGLNPNKARKFAQYCIEQLKSRENSESILSIEADEFPNLSAIIEVKQGDPGIYMSQATRGNSAIGVGPRSSFLHLGNLYGRLVLRIHDAFMQLTEFREEKNLGFTQPDWIYIKADTKSLTRTVLKEEFSSLTESLVMALGLEKWMRVVINHKVCGSASRQS